MELSLDNTQKRKAFSAAGAAMLSAVLLLHPVSAEAAEELSPAGYGALVTLDDAVMRALKNQAEVKRAFSRLSKEQALYKGSLSEFLPKLSAEFFGAVATGEKKTVSYLDAGIEQPLFKGGKILAGKRKQKARVEGEETKLEEVKYDVELGIRILYAEVLLEKESTRIAQGQVKELQAEHERIKRLTDKEVLPLYELFRLESMLQRSKHALVKHKETYDYLLGVLMEAVSLAEGEALRQEPLTDFAELEENSDVYLDTARRYDPVYRIWDLKTKEKQFEKRELQADRFPEINLTARWNRNDDVFVDTNRAMVGAEVKWDIWNFGRLGSKINAKAHEIEETKWEGEIKVREHEKAIRKLFHEGRTLREKIRLAESLVQERQEIYKNEKTRLIAGELGAGELIDSFIAFEEAKIGRLRAITDYRVLMARLDRLTAFKGISSSTEAEDTYHYEE